MKLRSYLGSNYGGFNGFRAEGWNLKGIGTF